MTELVGPRHQEPAPARALVRPPDRPPLWGWPVVLTWAILIGTLAQVPNLIGYRMAGPSSFIGGLGSWPEDVTYHLTFPEQARRGALLFEDKYNGNRAQTRLILNTYFLTIGHAARVLGLSVSAAALGARLIVGIMLLLVAHFFARPFLRTRVEQGLFLVLAPFGSGLGWLHQWSGHAAQAWDVATIETSTFAAMADDLITPITTTLVLLTIGLLDRALASPSCRKVLLCGASALLLGTVHPHDLLVTVYATAALATLLRAVFPRLRPDGHMGATTALRVVLGILACSLPILIYDAYVLWREPLFWDYVALNDGFEIHLVASGLGVPLAVGALGAAAALRSEPARFLTLIVWLAAALLLLFVPVPPCSQFFLLHGIPIGLALLTARGLGGLWARHGRPSERATLRASCRRAALSALVVVLVACSTLTIVVHAQRWHHLLKTRPPDRFVPEETVAALRWLGAHAQPDQTLLAGQGTSRLAPVLAGLRVFAAQPEQTVDFGRRMAAARAFFRRPAAPASVEFLAANGIAYVLVGPEERRLARRPPDAELLRLPSLRKVFSNRTITVYERTSTSPVHLAALRRSGLSQEPLPTAE